MRGREAQAFVDPVVARTKGGMDSLLTTCWEETIDPGPYALTTPKNAKEGTPAKLSWQQVLLGDRFVALVEIRALTFGSMYEFFVKCEECNGKYGWELDLADLERKPLSKEAAEKIASNDNRFELPFPDGKIMVYKLPTGLEEMKIANLRGGQTSQRKLGPVDAIWVQALDLLIPDDSPDLGSNGGTIKINVNAAAPREGFVSLPGGPMAIRRYLDDINYPDLVETIEAMQANDCGLETKIETVCEHCNWQQWIELPFQRSFFERPKKKTEA